MATPSSHRNALAHTPGTAREPIVSGASGHRRNPRDGLSNIDAVSEEASLKSLRPNRHFTRSTKFIRDKVQK